MSEEMFEDLDDPKPEVPEAEKIEALVKEYTPLLEATDMDICRSVKGKWFFFRYSKRYSSFGIYLEFETAEELIDIIIGELCLDMNMLIDKDCTIKEHLHRDIGDFIQRFYDHESDVEEFRRNMETIAKYSALTIE